MKGADEAGPFTETFSEKAFYLSEFRGRTLAFAARAEDLTDSAPLESVLKELEANRTRAVLLSGRRDAIERILGTPVLAADAPRLEAQVWRALCASPRVGIAVGEGDFVPAACDAATRLQVAKLVWLDPAGGLLREDGARFAFLDVGPLRALIARDDCDRRALLSEIESSLAAGLPAVNLCAPAEVGDELFTYTGRGTLFTREGYVAVRKLSIDDFDAAADLIARGVSEGYLAPRTPEQIESVLANGFGAFVEGRHLAGIAALLRHPADRAGELVSLYTLTRFVGEGVGAHLVAFALERAAVLGCRYVFACTTSERVVGFFERNRFRRVDATDVPAEKWRDYDPARRSAVRCLRRDLT